MKYGDIDYNRVVDAKSRLLELLSKYEGELLLDPEGFPSVARAATYCEDNTQVQDLWIIIQCGELYEYPQGQRGWDYFYLPKTLDVLQFCEEHKDEELNYHLTIHAEDEVREWDEEAEMYIWNEYENDYSILDVRKIED